jgi:hypothetical protein
VSVSAFVESRLKKRVFAAETSMIPRNAAYDSSSMKSFGDGVAVATKRYGTSSSRTRAFSVLPSPANVRMNSRNVFVPPKPRRTLASSSDATVNCADRSCRRGPSRSS